MKIELKLEELEKQLDEISREVLICPYCDKEVSDSTSGYYVEVVGGKVEMYSCDCCEEPIDLYDLYRKRVLK